MLRPRVLAWARLRGGAFPTRGSLPAWGPAGWRQRTEPRLIRLLFRSGPGDGGDPDRPGRGRFDGRHGDAPIHPDKFEAEEGHASRSFCHLEHDALAQDAFEDVTEGGANDDPFNDHPVLRLFGHEVLTAC